MYKVFVNDKPIIITDSSQKDKKFLTYFFDEVIIDEIIYRFKTENIKGVYLITNNLEQAWRNFRENFKVVKAAGGLVFNQNKEILFIYRGNKWDLPKGRVEEGEEIETTAIREIEEECSVFNLKIDSFLTATYHIFYKNNKAKLKETFWFLMHTDFTGKPIPQKEEGIVEAVFKDHTSTLQALQNTFVNIGLVYEAYQKGLD
ncbi:NUDIX hydrolase [Tenacibaculum todarodis]|nr:NUDIX domain-containing protein [Tenacibaculum todarodis]